MFQFFQLHKGCSGDLGVQCNDRKLGVFFSPTSKSVCHPTLCKRLHWRFWVQKALQIHTLFSSKNFLGFEVTYYRSSARELEILPRKIGNSVPLWLGDAVNYLFGQPVACDHLSTLQLHIFTFKRWKPQIFTQNFHQTTSSKIPKQEVQELASLENVTNDKVWKNDKNAFEALEYLVTINFRQSIKDQLGLQWSTCQLSQCELRLQERFGPGSR